MQFEEVGNFYTIQKRRSNIHKKYTFTFERICDHELMGMEPRYISSSNLYIFDHWVLLCLVSLAPHQMQFEYNTAVPVVKFD